MIKRAVDVLDLERLDLIIVENVGNLVCPTDFDLGENAKVMILSVPEGDDKPLKYPGVFQVAEAVVLNKVDTMPVFNFDREAFEAAVTQLNPQAPSSHRRHERRRRGRLGRVAGEPHSRRLVPTACQPSERSRRCEAPMRPISPLFRFPSRAKARFPKGTCASRGAAGETGAISGTWRFSLTLVDLRDDDGGRGSRGE